MGPGSNPENIFDQFFGPGKPGSKKVSPKEEKGPIWHAKEINGVKYVPIEEVHQLLEMNDVLPKVRRGLEKHFKKETPNGN